MTIINTRYKVKSDMELGGESLTETDTLVITTYDAFDGSMSGKVEGLDGVRDIEFDYSDFQVVRDSGELYQYKIQG